MVVVSSTCKHGHPWTPENTYERDGKRWCRKCRALKQREYRLEHPEVQRRWRENHPDYDRAYYEELMASPEGRWMQRSKCIRWRISKGQQISEKPTTPIGVFVRNEINLIGERVWRDIASKTT